MDAKTTIDEVGEGIYRIATWDPTYGITFNQFLIADDAPTLVHTGPHQAYERVRDAVKQVLDPAKLAYVVVPHFEADECGGMGRFVAAAPNATLVASEAGAMLNLSGWDFNGPFKGMRDGTTLDLGRHKLRFLETPHVHHWDSMMVYEESTGSVFPSDLYLQPGDQPPTTDENLSAPMIEVYRGIGIFAHENPVRTVVDRIEALDPAWIHAMHGASLKGEALHHYNRALREQEFAYNGLLLGRDINAVAAAAA